MPLDGHAPQIPGLLPKRPPTGGTRTDGSRITAGVPTAIPLPEAGDPSPGLDPGITFLARCQDLHLRTTPVLVRT